MTPNKRIFLNVMATYGRSLYALACGLFTSRWVLMALGQTDYGLYGVVGGLVGFVAFLNGILAVGVGRFYAINIGRCRVDYQKGLSRCQYWVTMAILLHTIIPIILVLIGYPIGVWAVRSFLDIPGDRIEACILVWRFACLSSLVGMMNVPFQALYVAKQEIAELTIYSLFTTTLNVVFIYYIVNHPGVWLTRYAFWMCTMSVIPQLIIGIRAFYIFPECRFRLRYIRSWHHIGELLTYCGWNTLGLLGRLLQVQGIAVLFNKYFGPNVNAAATIGNNLSHQCDTLSGSMTTAFSPAIMNAYGAGDLALMRRLAFRACKIGTICVLVFALPLMLEIQEVLLLWLKNPPHYTAGLFLCVMVTVIIDKTAVGHMLAVCACGKIARYQIVLGTSLILALPAGWIFVEAGFGVYSIGIALIVSMAMCSWGRVWFARRLTGMSAWYWIRTIMIPLFLSSVCAVGIGCLPKLYLEPSFMRVFLTTFMINGTFLPLIWFFVIDNDERAFVCQKIEQVVGKLKMRHVRER